MHNPCGGRIQVYPLLSGQTGFAHHIEEGTVRKEQKHQLVDQLQEELSEAVAVIVVEYKGITVDSMTQLRVKLREKEASFRVVKNTLLKLACQGHSNDKLADLAGGPIAIAFTKGDPAAMAKELTGYAKGEKTLVIRGGVLSGKLMDSTGVADLATLPSLDEMRARTLALFQAPAQQLLSLLLATPRNVLGVLQARKEKLEEAENG